MAESRYHAMNSQIHRIQTTYVFYDNHLSVVPKELDLKPESMKTNSKYIQMGKVESNSLVSLKSALKKFHIGGQKPM